MSKNESMACIRSMHCLDTNDINEVIPVVTIAIEFYGNTKVITVYHDN